MGNMGRVTRKSPSRAATVAGRAAPVSQTAEYALRAMAMLAKLDHSALRAKDLSVETGVPVHYLSKVLRRLVAAGLLRARKGHGGGFALTRPPEQTRIADVLAAVGGAHDTTRCAFGWGNCDARHPCPLHPTWTALNNALTEWGNTTTLADLGPLRPRRGRRRT
jgi:Rrf2 family transcriptional regulator, iron-sulfur cluster assembly transcription factor